MNTLSKASDKKLSNYLPEIAKQANIQELVVASQLRVTIVYRPKYDKNFDYLSRAYRPLFTKIAPLMRQNRMSTTPCCPNNIEDMINRSMAITTGLLKEYCTEEKIDRIIRVMDAEKILSVRGDDELIRYRPSFEEIQRTFLENGLHVEWEWKLYNKDWWRSTAEEREKIARDERDYLLRMLREIIICDFEKKVFERTDRDESIIRMGQEGKELNDVWPQSMWHICMADYYSGDESDF